MLRGIIIYEALRLLYAALHIGGAVCLALADGRSLILRVYGGMSCINNYLMAMQYRG